MLHFIGDLLTAIVLNSVLLLLHVQFRYWLVDTYKTLAEVDIFQRELGSNSLSNEVTDPELTLTLLMKLMQLGIIAACLFIQIDPMAFIGCFCFHLVSSLPLSRDICRVVLRCSFRLCGLASSEKVYRSLSSRPTLAGPGTKDIAGIMLLEMLHFCALTPTEGTEQLRKYTDQIRVYL